MGGTASTMNSLAEALGMSLTGNANIPAPYRERGQMAYKTGLRIVDMVKDDLTPSMIMTRESFENAIIVNSAIGGSTNAQWHYCNSKACWCRIRNCCMAKCWL